MTERSGSELTRQFLLNSHSRGSLNEVLGEDDLVEFAEEAEFGVDGDEESLHEEEPFYKQWEGRDLTRKYYLQSYD
ncbi:hypothetical protein [Paenibacillus caui]|uniref:hypothetical protein n=1 Tax=Paenibacillus caui TaxID=2873927 RepID=UPI001CA84F07|nr:hypothetical protein [Paenibacillus caui]